MMMEGRAMWWSLVGALGLVCLAVAALVAFGPAAGLAVAGCSLLAAAVDGRR